MITEHKMSKDTLAEALVEDERRELLEYCKLQGYTEEQTETFVRNSLERLGEAYLGE